MLDETGRLPDAIRAYQSAISLAPTYAVPITAWPWRSEKASQPRKNPASRQAYARLDTVGPWSIPPVTDQKNLADELKIVPRRSKTIKIHSFLIPCHPCSLVLGLLITAIPRDDGDFGDPDSSVNNGAVNNSPHFSAAKPSSGFSGRHPERYLSTH